jgi:transcriptional regulator with XRE-family HTH domain
MIHLAMMDIKLKVAHRIKELRAQLGISQEALANKANLDRTYVTDVENGRRNISIGTLVKLINALDISIADFFNKPDFQ